jgi:Pyruvate phosphate dikinase, AMP/ATP-binding domain
VFKCEGARDALVDDFRNGTLAECKDRCAERHRLDHYQAERLRPIDREQKGLSLAQEFSLSALIDLADELDLDPDRVGPKAANLAALARAGLPTPSGFCLTASAYRWQIAALGLDDVVRPLA